MKFPALKILRIDARGAHGDDGSMIDRILQSAPKLQELTLIFPRCDLKGCRIKGISWEYTFPALETCSISTYNTDNTALSKFLVSHPTITNLDWDVDSDENFIFPPTSLPILRALKLDDMDVLCGSQPLSSAKRPITHLRLECCCPCENSLEITNLAKTLKFLELESCIYHSRPDSDSGINKDGDNDSENADGLGLSFPQITKNLLLHLPELQELAVDLETGFTYFRGKDGKFEKRKPTDVNDLVNLIGPILCNSVMVLIKNINRNRFSKLSYQVLVSALSESRTVAASSFQMRFSKTFHKSQGPFSI